MGLVWKEKKPVWLSKKYGIDKVIGSFFPKKTTKKKLQWHGHIFHRRLDISELYQVLYIIIKQSVYQRYFLPP